MITLQVEPYCHSCNDFEAHVIREFMGFDDGGLYSCKVTCEHRDRCAAVAKYIKGELKNG